MIDQVAMNLALLATCAVLLGVVFGMLIGMFVMRGMYRSRIMKEGSRI